MKKIILLIGVFLLIPLVLSLGDNLNIVFDSGSVSINTSIIAGTNIDCSDVTGGTLDVCSGNVTGGGGSGNSTSDIWNVVNNGTFVYKAGDTMTGNLNVLGDINSSTLMSTPQICLNGDCQTSWSLPGNWNQSSSNLFPALITSNIGIGTLTPTNKLEVIGNVSISKNLTVGEDLIVSNKGFFSGKLFSTDWSNVTILTSQITDFVSNVWNQSGTNIIPALESSNVVLTNNLTADTTQASIHYYQNRTTGSCFNGTHIVFSSNINNQNCQ